MTGFDGLRALALPRGFPDHATRVARQIRPITLRATASRLWLSIAPLAVLAFRVLGKAGALLSAALTLSCVDS